MNLEQSVILGHSCVIYGYKGRFCEQVGRTLKQEKSK